MSPLLLATIEPPAELSAWVGALVLTAIVTAVVGRFSKSGDKEAAANAEWKAELRADLKRLIEVQNQLVSGQQLQSKDIASLSARQDQLDKRQSEQAAAHQRDLDSIKSDIHGTRAAPRKGR